VTGETTGGGEEGAAGVPGRTLMIRKRSTLSAILRLWDRESRRAGGPVNCRRWYSASP
jgi:hypothetical protein